MPRGMTRALCAVAAVAALGLMTAPAGAKQTPPATIYVGVCSALTGCSSGKVVPFDTATNNAGTKIPVGRGPNAIAITPDGKTAYVANYESASVTPIDTATNTAGPPITGIGSFPDEIAITPDGKTAYVVNGNSPGTVTPIDTATNTAGPAIPVKGFARDIVITPDSKTAYVATTTRFGTSSTVIPINTATNTAGPAIPLSKEPGQMAITPNGATLYVTLHKATGSVVPISTATNTVGTPISAGIKPSLIAISPDGTKAYVVSETHNTVKKIYSTSLRSITIATGAVSKQIIVKRSSEPNYVIAMVFTPSSKTLYALGFTRITGSPGYLVAVDTATNTASSHFPVGRYPGGMAITP